MYEPTDTETGPAAIRGRASPPKAPRRQAAVPRAARDPFARHVGGHRRPAIPPLEPRRPRASGRRRAAWTTPEPRSEPAGDDPFARFVRPDQGPPGPAIGPAQLSETGDAGSAPPEPASPEPSRGGPAPTDPFSERIDAAAATLAVAPRAPELPSPAAVSAPAPEPAGAPTPRPPAPAQRVPPHPPPAPRGDPFARFIEEDGRDDARLPPLREATARPAPDPFASRIAGDSARAAPPPAQVFSDPLGARIDPGAGRPADGAAAAPAADAPTPRFSRRVEAVAVALPSGSGAGSLRDEVRESRRERQSDEPGYALDGVVRRPPAGEKRRLRARLAHRNLLRSLLD